MTYTIISARYSNAEQTAITIETVEAGSVAISPADTPVLWGEVLASGLVITDYTPLEE